MQKLSNPFTSSCPVSKKSSSHVQLAHGGGGKLMQNLVAETFFPAFANPLLNAQHDGAILDMGWTRLAFTTDSYVVQPLFFPGGDIGTLAVNGTVNDLAMCGAEPRYLSAAFIIEEGFPMATLQKIVGSMRDAAQTAHVQLVTGDTKVVEKTKADGIFITTAGIGTVACLQNISPRGIHPGDSIIVSGDIGRHGMAIMAVREGLEFETTIESDCAPMNGLVIQLLDAHVEIHCMRDLTRGGLASALVEIAQTCGRQFDVDETAIPVAEEVRGACEILGFDPLYVANEGRFVAFVRSTDCQRALEVMHAHPLGRSASVIGQVTYASSGNVQLKSPIGASRVLHMLSGEQLPRIC